MVRPGTKLARQLLRQIKTDFDVDVDDLRSRCGDVNAQVAFIVRAKALGLTYAVMAEVLGVSPVCIWYRVNPAARERRRLYKRRLRAMARESRRPSEWSIPTWDGYRSQYWPDIYSAGQVYQ
jgi:hypothetical protein